MAKQIIKVELDRPAKKAGGDRYTDGDFTTYIPQNISRPSGGTALKKIKITFEEG